MIVLSLLLQCFGLFCYTNSVQASDKEWMRLQGKFLLNGVTSKAVIYLEGPPMGIDILVNSFLVKRAKKLQSPPAPEIEVS